MSQEMEALYQAWLRRFVTALNNRKPDRVPIRPFAAGRTGDGHQDCRRSCDDGASAGRLRLVGGTHGGPGGADPGQRGAAQRVWEAADSGGATFIWQMLVSF